MIPEPGALAAAAAARSGVRRIEEDDIQVLEAGTSGGRLSYVSLVASCLTLYARRSLPRDVDPPSIKVDNLMADDGKQLADDPIGVFEDSDSDFELLPPLLPRKPVSARRLTTGSRLPMMAEPKESSQMKACKTTAYVDREPIAEFSSCLRCPVQIQAFSAC